MWWVKRIAWALGGAVAVLALAAVAGAAWLNSDGGKAWLQATANQSLAGEARVAQIGGTVPFHLALGQIELLDHDGVWAQLEDVHLDIAPWDLLRRRLTIERLSAAAVDMRRSRVAAQPAASKSAGLPLPPMNVDLRQLTLASVRLPPEMFGEPTTWTATAAGSVVGENVALRVSVHELDDASPVRLDAQFELSDRRANAHATIDDPRGLVLRRATGEALPLQLLITDDGAAQSPADWHGRLTASIGDRARLQAALHLAANGEVRVFDTDGEFDGARLLPTRLASLVEPSLKFHLAAREVEGVGWSLDGLRLGSDTVEAQGTGTYRSRGKLVDASLRVTLPDLARLASVAGAPTAGSADVVIAAKGPLDGLRAEVDAHGAHVGYAGNAVDDLAARVAIANSSSGYRINGEGTLAGVRSAAAPLPAHLGEAVSWTLAGTSDPRLATMRLTSFSLASAGLQLAADGTFDAPSQRVAGTVRLNVGDLHDFSELAPGLRGQATAVADVDGSLSGPARIRAQAGLDDLATGVPAVDALTGGRVRLEADLRRENGGTIILDSAALRAAAAQVTASGNADPATQKVSGDFAASIEDLTALRQAGMPAAGRIAVTGRISGPLSALTLAAHVDGAKLAWQTARIDRASFDLQGTTAGAPSGRLTGELRARDATVGVEAEANLSRDYKTVIVPNLRIGSGRDVIAARVRTALDTLLTDGQVTAALPDLQSLSPLAGVELGGRLDLNVALSPKQDQTAEVTLAADDVSATPPDTAPLRLHHVAAKGSLAGLLRRPLGRLDVRADTISAGSIAVHTVRLSANAARPDRFDFTGDVDGDFKGPFAVTTAGNVALTRDTTSVTVEQLTGRAAGTPLRLQRPLVVTSRGPVLTVADLGVAIGSGTLAGRVRRDGTSLDVNLDAARLPVELAAHFAGRDDLTGAVDARLEVAGPAAQPRGRISVSAHDIRAKAVASSAPPLSFAAEAALAAGRVDVTATADVADTRLLSATGAVPVVFGPQPGAVSLANDRPLNLSVHGDGELARLADLLPLAGDRVAGHIQLALEVTGTPARPQAQGTLSLKDGHYENLKSGLILDALAVDVDADRDRLVLRQLTSTDGGKGQLTGSGSVSLLPTPASNLTVSLNKFQALRRSDANLTASGSATVAGTLTAPVLVARLTVDHSEFFIPDPPPPGATKISVTVIDSSTGEVLSRSAPESETSGMGSITLDVAVRIPGNSFVRGRGLDSEWRGDVQARGTSAAPEVTGSLNVVHGTFSFFGKDMTLTRGTVTFTGGHKIAPTIDVLAETTTSGATFDVGATGTPDNLKIKLASTPAMPQDEILARLIFGTDVTRLSPVQGLQLAQAAASLSSGGPGVLDKVRQKVGLDVLSIGSMTNDNPLQPVPPQSSSTSTGTSNTGISGGKYVANGVYVGAVQGLSGETRSKVEVEIMPRVRVESQAGTRSEQFGVNWQLDY